MSQESRTKNQDCYTPYDAAGFEAASSLHVRKWRQGFPAKLEVGRLVEAIPGHRRRMMKSLGD